MKRSEKAKAGPKFRVGDRVEIPKVDGLKFAGMPIQMNETGDVLKELAADIRSLASAEPPQPDHCDICNAPQNVTPDRTHHCGEPTR